MIQEDAAATEALMQQYLASGDQDKVRHAQARMAIGFTVGVTAVGLTSAPSSGPTLVTSRAVKPRMSFDQLAAAKRACVPCQKAEPRGVGSRVWGEPSPLPTPNSQLSTPHTPQKATLPALSAAIVVPCHNYAHWLPEALESALAQSWPATEIVVVDDSSSDETPVVAASFATRGVRYLRIDAASVWEARKAGFGATHSDAVCFLDADDILPPDYLECGLPLFGERTGFVYSDYENFGDVGGRSSFPDFDRGLLECENFAHAGSLVRRRALEIAQVFDRPRPINTFADWYLWRRLADAGFSGAKSPALYRYRRHDGSMIVASRAAGIDYPARASLHLQDITIVCPLSGRDWAWPRYREWLEQQTWPRAQCRLLVLDTGPTAGVREWLSGCDYPDTRYARLDVGAKGLADADRTANVYEVRLAMSRIYRAAAAAVETPFAFVVEDDIVPPDDVIGRLMRSLDDRVAAVSGAYPSRFHPGAVAWSAWTPRTISTIRDGEGVQDVGGIGFGCVLLRRCVLAGETFALLPGESADYDVLFFERLRAKGWTVRLDWSARAEHRSAPLA